MTHRFTALVTGASAGLGAEFARQLAANGCNLVLVVRRVERLQALATQLNSQHPEIDVYCIEADLSLGAAPEQIYADTVRAGLHVDYLINNAGASGPDFLADQSWPQHLAYLTLMQTSVAELCHRFLPSMVERGFGRIINVSSVSGRISAAGNCHYGPTKAYLIALSEALGLTVKSRGVHVTALCPGFTHTDFHHTAGLKDLKESTPAFLWYSAETVVKEGLHAVEKGRFVCISGRLYRWVDPLLQSVWTRWLFLRPA